MDIRVFRDKRKKEKHIKKPAFQELMYNYPNVLHIDSVGVLNGNIIYVEQIEHANEAGRISFNKLKAKIYNITNDTIFKTQDGVFKLTAEALLMGKGKLSMSLEAKLFDKSNTFSLDGKLSSMEASALNPMVEKNAFVYINSGKVDGMRLNFVANNTKATGQMTMLYHGLKLTFKNKHTNDTTAIKEILLSFSANKKILDSNPIPGKEVRVGIIDYQKDPEKAIFNYWYKSALSGIKSSILKSRKGKRR